MVVLNWSCERSVCRSSRPAGTSSPTKALQVRRALPVAVGNTCWSRGGCGQDEPARVVDALVVVGEAGDHRLDAVADAVVVGRQPRPVDGRRRARIRSARPAHDGHLAAQVRRRRLEPTARRVDHAHRVLDGDALLAGHRSGRARCGRGTAGSAPPRPLTTCERLSLVVTCTVSWRGQRGRGRIGVGGGGQEVAADGRRTRRRRRGPWPGWRRRCRSRARAVARTRTRRRARRGTPSDGFS